MESDPKSITSDQGASSLRMGSGTPQNGWVRVGAIAVASALVGGLAAAWFYRKTLSLLREAGDEAPESRINEAGSQEDF